VGKGFSVLACIFLIIAYGILLGHSDYWEALLVVLGIGSVFFTVLAIGVAVYEAGKRKGARRG